MIFESALAQSIITPNTHAYPFTICFLVGSCSVSPFLLPFFSYLFHFSFFLINQTYWAIFEPPHTPAPVHDLVPSECVFGIAGINTPLVLFLSIFLLFLYFLLSNLLNQMRITFGGGIMQSMHKLPSSN